MKFVRRAGHQPRRFFWEYPAIALAILFGAAPASAAETLRVATFGGSFLEAIKANIEPKFRAATGATVEYDLAGPREHLAKMAAAKGQEPPFDIVELPADSQAEAIGRGLLEQVQPRDFANSTKLQPEAWIKPNYGPAREWIVSGLVFNADRLAENHVDPSQGFEMLRDAKLAGHVALPDIQNPVAPAFLAGLAKHLAGDETRIDAALKFIQGIKDPDFFPNFAVLQTRYAGGAIWALPGNLAYISRLTAGDSKTSFVAPAIGDKHGIGYGETVDVVQGTKNRALAIAWINAGIDTAVQIGMCKADGYSPSNKEAAAALAQDKAFARLLTSSADIAGMFFPDWVKINAAYPEWVQKWNRAIRN